MAQEDIGHKDHHSPDASYLSNLHLTTGHCFRQAEDTDESVAVQSLSNNELWLFENALTQSIPRSYSDYTTTLHNARRWRAHGEVSELGALWDVIRTDVISRHVVVRCGAGTWDALDVRRVVDRLNNFGAVASKRSELTAGGLLFCTFFDLTSAVAACDRWRADADIISFCLPYELPDDVNSATLLVRFPLNDGSPVKVSELRQVCACFGQVASILQPDTQLPKYIVEYCDSRVLPAALNGLPHVFQTSGPMSVAPTTSPTVDVGKLKLFQECLNRAATTHPRVARARPKSFSSSSTSLLTSPTSSVASSLNASFLEGANNNSPMASGKFLDGSGELTSPVLMPQDEQHIWARPAPRARSNSSSAYLGESRSSGRFGDSSAYPNGFTLPSSSYISTLSNRANGYSSFQAAHQLQPSNNQISFSTTGQQKGQQQQAYYDIRSRQRAQTQVAPMKSSHGNIDPFFQTSVAHNGEHAGVPGGSTAARPSAGRNDQGTGEFSLSIDKVASG
ncbi:unnamed protein product [Peronospora destructor]|uniref:RRM domain-containing protein n=1 Tax=Peronospora destructor TaxID=86335 RepID=A0AAV0VES4_9STRA|nr:unnamed protein product [Peronospora destructor]